MMKSKNFPYIEIQTKPCPMKPSILLSLILVATSPALAQQDSIYGYYDMLWKKVSDKNTAKYFRVVKDRPGGQYLVRDYYMSGALQFVGVSKTLEPKLDIQGEGTLYHESGSVQQVGHFQDEKAVGFHKYYYEDGTLRKVVFHREGEKDLFHQFWSREGEPKLVNGTGLAIDHFSGRPTQYYEIRDSVVIASFADDEDGNRVYAMVEQQPEYDGGYETLVKDLKANLEYPRSARKRHIEGTVYIAFVVGKNGEIADVRVLKGIQAECDAAAVQAVTKLNKWKPGMHQGQAVFVKYVLPIKFSLKGWSLF
jgi:TonB family protein